MIYRQFKDKKLSALGFGCMRLPMKDGKVDEAQVEAMTEYAISHGVNYFDTAYPYHEGMSERVMGKVLSKYPRESFYLADKFPGHQVMASYDPAPLFEEQLRRCRTDYFDFYLLHNIYEKSLETYLNPEYGILEYFKEQKRLGRIKHLGFSAHADVPCLKRFLDVYGDDMEFCQIQLNWLDWTLQNAKEKCRILAERNIPVWTMESIRGGRLAKLSEEDEAKLKARRPDESIASWGFRYLQGNPQVHMILSGISNMENIEDNVRTFSGGDPLTEEEVAVLMEIAEGMKGSIPCTGCRYCCDGCPMGLDIPTLLAGYNELRFALSPSVRSRVLLMPEDKRPSACIGCGKCSHICPQNIDVPAAMIDMMEKVWASPI